ncbi:MAG: 50S ribosomal protein L19 [Planctomycetota bacterium]|nr:MAG: 50S ribosomal protein L19 [Planctomycetota bacterium]
MSTPVERVEQGLGKQNLPVFSVGDHVSVGVLIREAAAKGAKNKEDRTRIQHFIGDVIAVGGSGLGRSFTVRRVVQGEGLERVFPFHSPLVKEVEVLRHGDVRRAKLYDLRTKSGKSARIKERRVTKADKLVIEEKAAKLAAKKQARRDADAASGSAAPADSSSES